MSAVRKVMLRSPWAAARRRAPSTISGQRSVAKTRPSAPDQCGDAERGLAGAGCDFADLLAGCDVGRLDERRVHAGRLFSDFVRPPVPVAPAPGPVGPHKLGLAPDRVCVHGEGTLRAPASVSRPARPPAA